MILYIDDGVLTDNAAMRCCLWSVNSCSFVRLLLNQSISVWRHTLMRVQFLLCQRQTRNLLITVWIYAFHRFLLCAVRYVQMTIKKELVEHYVLSFVFFKRMSD